jgi:hypothetical protein
MKAKSEHDNLEMSESLIGRKSTGGCAIGNPEIQQTEGFEIAGGYSVKLSPIEYHQRKLSSINET